LSDAMNWLRSAIENSRARLEASREQHKRDRLWQQWLRAGGSPPGQEHYADGVLVVCPRCGSANVVPILYGLPSEMALEAQRRGALALAGCCLPPATSRVDRLCCMGCQHRWPGDGDPAEDGNKVRKMAENEEAEREADLPQKPSNG
jgi:hypothetical protein